MKNVLREFLQYQKENPQITEGGALIDGFFEQSDTLDHSTWGKEDIRGHAEQLGVELTEDEVNKVADLVAHKTDANVGINWDSIADWIYYVKG